MSELFKKQQWSGTFFVNGENEKRFSGKIDYSPGNGLIFSYSIADHEVPDDINLVHGIFSTGEKCTLLGTFPFSKSGFSWNNNLHTRHGEIRIRYLVIGEWLEDKELFYSVSFSLTGMQEFLLLKKRGDFIKYPEKPLLVTDTDYGQLKIGNNAEYRFFDKDISSQIHSADTDALNTLKQMFGDLEKEYPDAKFWLKKNTGYRILLNITSGADIESIYKHIKRVADLFSVLTYIPVYPDSFRIIKEKKNSYPVYRTTFLPESTMKRSFSSRSHFDMPITQSKIDLGKILKKWLQIAPTYTTIVSSIQSRTGYHDEHSVHGDLVMYATQFEAISIGDLGDSRETRKIKYQYPIDTYGTEKIKEKISCILTGNGIVDDIGKGISELRNEIAHVGKPNELLKDIKVEDKVFLSRYLQLVILGFVLNNLGIDKQLIVEYQDKFS